MLSLNSDRSVGLGRWLMSLLILSLTAPLALAAADPATVAPDPIDAPTTQPVTGEMYQQAEQALEAALEGKFSQGLVNLREVSLRVPALAEEVEPAIALLREHRQATEADRAERAAEYALAVERMRHGLLAHDTFETMDEQLVDDLREKVLDVASAYAKIARYDSFEQATADEAAEMREQALTLLDEAEQPLADALAMLEEDTGEYANAFRAAAQLLEEQLAQYRQKWQEAQTDTIEARRLSSRMLRKADDDLADAVADLEVLIVEKPWLTALAQARLAKELAPEDTEVTETDWYAEVVSRAERIGREAVEQAEWKNALGAYIGLEALEKSNEHYQKMMKETRRHVRVLRMYGEDEDDDLAAAGETDDDDEAAEDEDEDTPDLAPTWEELVVGVDADMVKRAISQMDELYVTSVDYRKATRGALRAIRVLAETPQVRPTFPGLADEGRRKQFLTTVDSLLENVERRDRVDHLDLQLALNGVLRASERTVQLPVNVLAVEFMDGLLDELDKFSAMIWPYDVEDFQKQTMGTFYGVGIQITKEEGEPLKVVTPLADSPGYQAGLQTGDLILEVDGTPTEQLSIDKLVRMITGEKGSKVTLTVKRAGMPEPLEIAVIRDEIRIQTVKGWRRLDNGGWDFMIDPEFKLGYIRLTQFTGSTADDLSRALAELDKAGVRGVVLDLRFNPGGLLNSAVDVSDEFIRDGMIVSTRGRRTHDAQKAHSRGRYLDGNLIVLVNELSASAAEIVSGALKDYGRATIIGERTYGKGSVQRLLSIRRQSALLRLTTAYYYLPSGRLIHRSNGSETWGVEPDITVDLTPKQMRRWVELQRSTDLIRDIDAEMLQADLDEQLDADIQLSTALLMLKLKQIQTSGLATAMTAAE